MSAKDHGWPPDVVKQSSRICRRANGKLKRRYRSRAEAQRAADRAHCENFYACSWCGWWHIGTVKRGRS